MEKNNLLYLSDLSLQNVKDLKHSQNKVVQRLQG